MFNRTYVFKILLVVLTLLISTVTVLAENAKSNLVRIDILSVNDFHGAIAMTDRTPGAELLAGYLKAQKDKNEAGTLILSAGDMFQGTPDSNLLYGRTVVQFMNSVGFDAMALGNHEFDWGLTVLNTRMAQARFPFLAANVIDKSTGKPADFVKRYVIIEKDGVKIGIVGIVTPDTAVTTNPKNIEGFLFADPVQVLNCLVPEMRKQGADVIVVLAHIASYSNGVPGEGQITGEAAQVAWDVPGVSAIVSGHSHQKVAGEVNDIPIVQAGYSGKQAAAVHLVYSRNLKQVIAATEDVSDILQNGPRDITIHKIVAQAQSEVEPVKKIVLGSAPREMAHDRYQLTALGQWITDVMRQTAKTDIALENGGGIRAGLAAGQITAGNLYEIMPFDNNLYRVDLSGTQIKAALEHGINNKTFGMLQFSGLKVIYDPYQPEGQRVVSITLLDGSKLSASKMYSVATNDFLLAGGDGFSMLKEGRNIADTFVTLRDILGEAVRKEGKVMHDTDGRLIIKETKTMQTAA